METIFTLTFTYIYDLHLYFIYILLTFYLQIPEDGQTKIGVPTHTYQCQG